MACMGMPSEGEKGQLESNILIERLQKHYLPELLSLHADCSWLRKKFGLDGKQRLEKSETRLLNFVAAVETCVQQISNLDHLVVSHSHIDNLMELEAKISNVILPVKAKMLDQLQQQNNAFVPHNSETQTQLRYQGAFKGSMSVSEKKVAKAVSAGEHAAVAIAARKLAPHHAPALGRFGNNQDSQVHLKSVVEFMDMSVEELLCQNEMDSSIESNDDYQMDAPHHCVDVTASNGVQKSSKDLNASSTRQHSPTSLYEHQRCLSSDSIALSQYPSNDSSTSLKRRGSEEGLGVRHSASVDDCSRGDDVVSSKRRKRLNQIVPWPRKPRQADYSCSLCSEVYQVSSPDNPWWAIVVHECPKCHGKQVPRFDITSAANAIELDPNVSALYGEGVEDSCDDESYDGSDCDEADEENDEEKKPFNGNGRLSSEEASKLIILMVHARTCNGRHASPKHAEVCNSTKMLMLHIRDCSGFDVNRQPCRYPWCSPCKYMLNHLTRCYNPSQCSVCSGTEGAKAFQQLASLNKARTNSSKLVGEMAPAENHCAPCITI